MRVRLCPKDDLAYPEFQSQPPQPTSSDVSVEIAGGELVAAIRFEGVATPEVAAAQKQRLMDALEAGKFTIKSTDHEFISLISSYNLIL